ncbi:hypothetical protein CWB99_17675 [Pseudoalteromonas rubra]|uniref:Beta-lactamase-related domain-containing protein n=1 Tax=Pseudoalteromonas rubra TaxID=43658 RepID=A0A5S3WHL7_9GAMM|nr:hypothetical protein CWB99_17675 [Pseudoalteromonas rubra]TMP30667.1 hypothetical protein CWC00_15905 [Pseudoalteromonas rubra]
MTTLSNDYTRTTMKGIDILLQQHQVPKGPGYAVAVYQRGRVIYCGAAGLADIERNVSLTAASVFDIASVSKQFTAAALVILEKQGLLSLDDRLADYLDGLPEYCNSICLRHLLNHTSGLRDYNELLFQAGVQFDQAVSDSQALAMIKRQYALEFAPGEKFEYSNTGYFLLALVVQVVTGKTLSQFSQQAILTPLEMTSSYFWGRAGQDQPPVVKAYCDDGNDGYEPQMANWQTARCAQIRTTCSSGTISSTRKTHIGGMSPRDCSNRVCSIMERRQSTGWGSSLAAIGASQSCFTTVAGVVICRNICAFPSNSCPWLY